MENQFFVDSENLSEAALCKKHQLENDPSSRTNHMEYLPDMEQISSDIMDKVLVEMENYDYEKYTEADVKRALASSRIGIEEFHTVFSSRLQ